MVTNTPFEFVDADCHVQNVYPQVSVEDVASLRPLITHKRVQIQLNADLGTDVLGTVSLSPLGALALVSRLLQVLDEACKVQGLELPQLHSSFIRCYRDALFEGEPLSADCQEFFLYETAARMTECASDIVNDDTSGMLLDSILPPTLTK